MCLSKNEEEIEAIARKWASVISDKYVRQQSGRGCTNCAQAWDQGLARTA